MAFVYIKVPILVQIIDNRGINNYNVEEKQQKKRFTMEITKKSIIGDILDAEPDTAQFFFEIGMHCLGCPHSRGESVEDACMVHSTDADALIKKINDFLAAKK